MWVGESLEMSIWENKAVISNTNTEKYEETVVVHWKRVILNSLVRKDLRSIFTLLYFNI